MSQAGQINSAAGPVPPTVLTSFTTDLGTTFDAPSAGTGTTVPAANNVRAAGDMGIETLSDPAQPSVLLIRFLSGEVQTTDATQTTIRTFTMTSNTTLTYQVIIAGYSTDNLAVGGNTIATFKNVAGTTSVIDSGDLNINCDGGLVGSVFGVDVSGATIIFWVKGIAGKTINWSVNFPGIVSSP